MRTRGGMQRVAIINERLAMASRSAQKFHKQETTLDITRLPVTGRTAVIS